MPAAGRSYAAFARGSHVFARALGLTGLPWEVARLRLDVHLKRLDIDRDTHFPHRTPPALRHPRQRAAFLEIPQPSQRIGPVLRLERRPEDDNIGVNSIIPIDATSTRRAGGSPGRPDRTDSEDGWANNRRWYRGVTVGFSLSRITSHRPSRALGAETSAVPSRTAGKTPCRPRTRPKLLGHPGRARWHGTGPPAATAFPARRSPERTLSA